MAVKICDNCSVEVPFLLEVKVYMSNEGNWKYFLAELCHKCNDKLYKMEQELRLYAILKAHDAFMKGMNFETIKHKLVYNEANL